MSLQKKTLKWTDLHLKQLWNEIYIFQDEKGHVFATVENLKETGMKILNNFTGGGHKWENVLLVIHRNGQADFVGPKGTCTISTNILQERQ